MGSPPPSLRKWKSRPRTSTSAIEELLDDPHDLGGALERQQVASFELDDADVGERRGQQVGPRAERRCRTVHAEDGPIQARQAGCVDGRLGQEVGGDGRALPEVARALRAPRSRPTASFVASSENCW